MRVLLKAEEYEKVLPRLAAEIIEKADIEKLAIVGIRTFKPQKFRKMHR